ncbi:MAG: ABC transporter substrate-binding protein [Lachnospiraceae bacterium]
MIKRHSIATVCCVMLIGLAGLCGCGSSSDTKKDTVGITKEATSNVDALGEPTDHLQLAYAKNFSIDYYEGGYKLLTIKDGTQILTVPEGKKAPDNLDESIIVMQQPVNNIYLVSSAVMDMFRELNALDTIGFSAQKAENWYVEGAKAAMENGDILYAGKYSSPDYELLVSKKCSLAIENSMILHSPEVKEMLEDFDIPVIIEYSSYETHPLGRVEWIKFFGALTGKEKEAEEAFKKQTEIVDQVTAKEKTDKTVGFFYITSNGLVQVRQSSDYIPKMIELAGGKYIFENLGDSDSKRSTMNMQVEEFYNGAKDADFLIYNSTVDGGVKSINELVKKCPVLADFKAVKSGNVWCTERDVYQQSMSIGYLIEDIHNMLQGADDKEMNYLYRLN